MIIINCANIFSALTLSSNKIISGFTLLWNHDDP